MKNGETNTMMIYGFLKDGNEFSVSPITGKELIHKVYTDDYAMPPDDLIFDTQTKDGQRVRIVVPFSNTEKSYAIIGAPTE
jgi:hypothetical protein